MNWAVIDEERLTDADCMQIRGLISTYGNCGGWKFTNIS